MEGETGAAVFATISSHVPSCNMKWICCLLICGLVNKDENIVRCAVCDAGQALPEVQLVVTTAAAAVAKTRHIVPPTFAPHSMTADALQTVPSDLQQADSNAPEASDDESSADATARVSSSEPTTSRPTVVEVVQPAQATSPASDQGGRSAAQPDGGSFGGYCPALLADGAGLLWPAQRGLPLLHYASRSG